MQQLLIQKRHIKSTDHCPMYKVKTQEKIQKCMKAKIFYNFKKTQVKGKLKTKAMIKYIMILNMTMSILIIMMKRMNMKINKSLLIFRKNHQFQKQLNQLMMI
jgi:hypothetical protein